MAKWLQVLREQPGDDGDSDEDLPIPADKSEVPEDMYIVKDLGDENHQNPVDPEIVDIDPEVVVPEDEDTEVTDA